MIVTCIRSTYNNKLGQFFEEGKSYDIDTSIVSPKRIGKFFDVPEKAPAKGAEKAPAK
jgi:hypothetical protein